MCTTAPLGGGASTTIGRITWGFSGSPLPIHNSWQGNLPPLWAWGKHNNPGVLGFPPSHPQQRILAPLWAWGKHNNPGVLGFPPSHPQQRILAPLWALGKHNNPGVLGFSPSHPQQRILAPLWAWGCEGKARIPELFLKIFHEIKCKLVPSAKLEGRFIKILGGQRAKGTQGGAGGAGHHTKHTNPMH